MEIKKLTTVVNKATYLIVVLFPSFSFIKKCSIKATKFQSGFIYQYAFVMLLGFSALLTFLIVK